MPATKLKVGQAISPPILSAGPHRITALLRYSSGRSHGAIDIACPTGTKLFAPFSGLVTASSDGVPNNRPGENIWSGKPSNWILLKCKIRTTTGRKQDATIFLQHLSPGLRVKTGQQVKKGQLLGFTGNSGNSTGPHLHAGAQWVQAGRGSGANTRYDHVNSAALRVWGPERYIGLDQGGTPDMAGEVVYEYKFLGKPSGKQTIGRKYVTLDSSKWNGSRKGREDTLVYLNMRPEFYDGKQAGAIRIRVMRGSGDGAGADELLLHRDALDDNGKSMQLFNFWESSDAEPTTIQVKCVGGVKSCELSTRYTKKSLIFRKIGG